MTAVCNRNGNEIEIPAWFYLHFEMDANIHIHLNNIICKETEMIVFFRQNLKQPCAVF